MRTRDSPHFISLYASLRVPCITLLDKYHLVISYEWDALTPGFMVELLKLLNNYWRLITLSAEEAGYLTVPVLLVC